jgi:hypothetical protein
MWEWFYVDLVSEEGEWRFLNIEVLTDFSFKLGEMLITIFFLREENR